MIACLIFWRRPYFKPADGMRKATEPPSKLTKWQVYKLSVSNRTEAPSLQRFGCCENLELLSLVSTDGSMRNEFWSFLGSFIIHGKFHYSSAVTFHICEPALKCIVMLIFSCIPTFIAYSRIDSSFSCSLKFRFSCRSLKAKPNIRSVVFEIGLRLILLMGKNPTSSAKFHALHSLICVSGHYFPRFPAWQQWEGRASKVVLFWYRNSVVSSIVRNEVSSCLIKLIFKCLNF